MRTGKFIGLCPELFYGGTHGDNAEEVFRDLREMVEEEVEDRLRKGEGRPRRGFNPPFSIKGRLCLEQSEQPVSCQSSLLPERGHVMSPGKHSLEGRLSIMSDVHRRA